MLFSYQSGPVYFPLKGGEPWWDENKGDKGGWELFSKKETSQFETMLPVIANGEWARGGGDWFCRENSIPGADHKISYPWSFIVPWKYQKGEQEEVHTHTYIIDFKKMTQSNYDMNTTRDICRAIVT